VGSVLRPASYNGVVGFKPTFGLVSRYGVIPVSWTLDTMGWMTRTVADAALLLQVMAGPDPQDPVSRRQPVPDYLAGLEGARPPRIGLLRGLFYDHADAETWSHVNAVAQLLSRAGAQVDELPLPDSIDTAVADQQLIMAVEGAAFHQPMFQKQAADYQPRLREMIQRGLDADAVSYSRAKERRRSFVTDMRLLPEKADILLTPSTPSAAPADVSNTGNPIFQGPWTSCGFPAISIPSGLAASGLPLGIQLAAGPGAEAGLLAAARWCERVLDVDLSPPLDGS
jgi:aspartyl-tRNA(Asn)/glutamyl-tRNA(Gln) amidotransferase subunit A